MEKAAGAELKTFDRAVALPDGHFLLSSEEGGVVVMGLLAQGAAPKAKSGLEERTVAMARDVALGALMGLPSAPMPAAGLEKRGLLVFTRADPDLLRFVPMALRWGRPVAVDADGPEVEALRPLLAEMEKRSLIRAPYALGQQATRGLISEFDPQKISWIKTPQEALRELGLLTPEDLPQPVAEILEAVQRYFDAYAAAGTSVYVLTHK